MLFRAHGFFVPALLSPDLAPLEEAHRAGAFAGLLAQCLLGVLLLIQQAPLGFARRGPKIQFLHALASSCSTILK